MDEHVRNTHGLSSPNVLKPKSTIEVDAKNPFVLDSAHDIEQVGSDRREQIFHDIFTRCVSRGVFSKTTSKNAADLNENRSVEFLTELKKATSTSYYPRFEMKLKSELGGRSIEGSFTAKWEQVEKSFYNAIGKEQNISRLSSFFAKDHSNFNSKPMELIIVEVDSHIDRTLGRSAKTFTDKKGRIQADITFLVKTKYSIIFQISNNLPPEVKLMKDYILQVTANILDDIELLIDIIEFKDNLTIEFDKKGNLGDYKTFLVPAYKKNLTVNETKIIPDKKKDKKDNASTIKSMKVDFSKERKPTPVDNKFREKMNQIAVKLAQYVSLKDTERH